MSQQKCCSSASRACKVMLQQSFIQYSNKVVGVLVAPALPSHNKTFEYEQQAILSREVCGVGSNHNAHLCKRWKGIVATLWLGPLAAALSPCNEVTVIQTAFSSKHYASQSSARSDHERSSAPGWCQQRLNV